MTNYIEAVSVNHNTSSYMELMLRSLFAHQQQPIPLSLTIYDNASTDDMTELRNYASAVGVPIISSGFDTNTQNNSHGEVLRRFVLDHPDCSHYLFLDADVCFVQDNTLQLLLSELEQHPNAFGIGALPSWDGIIGIPADVRHANPDICDARLHPCCALMRNTPLFRNLADAVGFSAIRYLWAAHTEYRDTMKLFTQTMQAYGQPHIVSSGIVQHFFAVSYDWDDEETRRYKAQLRDEQLHALRKL